MNEYLILIKGGYKEHAAMTEEEKNSYYEKWGAYMDKLNSRNILVGGAPLADVGTVVTGKFDNQEDWQIEPDKSVGGYIILKADSLQSAVEEVRGCPIFVVNGTVEIRQVESM